MALVVLKFSSFFVDYGEGDGVSLSNTKYLIDKYQLEATLVDGDNKGNEKVCERWIDKEYAESLPTCDLFCIDLDGNDYYLCV